MIDPLEQAFLRLRDAADADECVPTEQVIDTVLARLATASRERDEALRLLARLSRSSTTTAPAISDTPLRAGRVSEVAVTRPFMNRRYR